MKIQVIISYDLNKVFLTKLKDVMGSELYTRQEIVTYTPTLEMQRMRLSITPEVLMKIPDFIDTEILVIYSTPVTPKVIDAGKRLKLIVSARGGPVNVDIDAANKAGVLVSHAPGHNAEAVADHSVALMLALVRQVVIGTNIVKGGFWKQGQKLGIRNIYEMKGKTLGIIGFGNVGSRIPQRTKGFGMNILVCDPYVDEKIIKKTGAEKVDFETLLRESDFITSHVRLSKEVYHMFGEKEFNLIKPTAYFVNTSRGPVVEQTALYNALRDNKIAGAGIDVFEEEPIGPDDPLLTLPNVILTPHLAASGTDFERACKMAAEEVNRFVRGEPLKHIAKASLFKFEREMFEKIFKGRTVH